MVEETSRRPEIDGYWGDAFTLATTTTIDSTNDGYLNCMRRHFGDHRLHGSTAAAVDNLVAGARTAQIVGHGETAIFVTGTGTSANDPAKYVATGNPSRWRPEFRRLKGKIDSLRIISCYTGSNAAGASLLHEIARECGASVSAPTGLTWCGSSGWWLDPGAQWQTATPTHLPSPIPKDPEGLAVGEANMLKLYYGDEPREYETDAVSRVQYVSPQMLDDVVAFAEGSEAADLAELAGLDRPFRPGAVPGAIVTGRLQIALRGQDIPKTLTIYADALLQDDDFPEVFYRARPGFAEALRLLAVRQ
ncbi:MAG TPA: hypothetical protein VES88_10100 [Gemmatimonadaceae bacterium]|nr:hypothetical protein [Gemmatimonadaceae bacterium]